MNAFPVDSDLLVRVEPSGERTVTVLLEIVEFDSIAERRVPAVPSNASSSSSPVVEVIVTGAPLTAMAAGVVPVTLLVSVAPPVAFAVAVIVVDPAAAGVYEPV